jgi:hypothetical protein
MKYVPPSNARPNSCTPTKRVITLAMQRAIEARFLFLPGVLLQISADLPIPVDNL